MKKLYSFLDSKTGLLTPPTAMQSHAEALRSLYQLAINGNQSLPLLQFAEDFTLFHIADWDDEKGVSPIESWENVGNVGAILSRFRLEYAEKMKAAQSASENSQSSENNDSSNL